MSRPTSGSSPIVTDTIVRTVEPGVTITDDALDGETPDVFADLQTSGAGPCLGCGEVGIFRDRIERRLIGSPTAQVMTTVRGASP